MKTKSKDIISKCKNLSISKLQDLETKLFKDYQKAHSKSEEALEAFKRVREILNDRYDSLDAFPIEQSPTYQRCQARITPEKRAKIEQLIINQGL